MSFTVEKVKYRSKYDSNNFIKSLGLINDLYVIEVKVYEHKTMHDGECQSHLDTDIKYIVNILRLYFPVPQYVLDDKSNKSLNLLMKNFKCTDWFDKYECGCDDGGSEFELAEYKIIEKTAKVIVKDVSELKKLCPRKYF